MKILLVIDQFFSANNGMTISARRFASTLEAHGNEIRVVSTGKEGDTEYLMKKQYIPIFDKLVAEQGMTFAKTDINLVEKAVLWADVIHFLVPFILSHNTLMLAIKYGKPYTAAFHVQPENVTSSIHLNNFKFINDGLYYWFRHYLFKYCNHIHCPSRFIANQLRLHGYKNQLHIISNGIDPDFVYRKIKKPDELSSRFLILSVGRLSVEKRQDLIIKAIAESKFKDSITLMLAGQGPQRENLRKLADKYGVDVRMKFYEKSELLDLIAYCDLYVHAADAEIEAMACMEAFAGGLVPIISDSKKSATPQFAFDKRNLFRAGCPTSLASRIDYWINNPAIKAETEIKYGKYAKQFNLDNCVRRVEDMFRLAIKEKENETADNSVGNKGDR